MTTELSILIKESNIQTEWGQKVINMRMTSKYDTYTKILNRIARDLERELETQLFLVSRITNRNFRKYQTSNPGAYLTMQIIGRSTTETI